MTTQISAETISPQTPVITTELLAQLYCCEVNSIKVNHSRNQGRFVEGKHYFKLVGDDLKNLRVTLSNSQNPISAKARALILWTERGVARHAKMLETDQAWEVFERLEDCYFSQQKMADLPTTGNGPISLDILLAIRDDKVAFIKQHQAGTLITVDEALSLFKSRGWLVMPREELAGKLMEL